MALEIIVFAFEIKRITVLFTDHRIQVVVNIELGPAKHFLSSALERGRHLHSSDYTQEFPRRDSGLSECDGFGDTLIGLEQMCFFTSRGGKDNRSCLFPGRGGVCLKYGKYD